MMRSKDHIAEVIERLHWDMTGREKRKSTSLILIKGSADVIGQ